MHELSEQKEEYTRGFRQTKGIIGPEGVYLDGGSGWVPRFNDRLIRFSVRQAAAEVARDQPRKWHLATRTRVRPSGSQAD